MKKQTLTATQKTQHSYTVELLLAQRLKIMRYVNSIQEKYENEYCEELGARFMTPKGENDLYGTEDEKTIRRGQLLTRELETAIRALQSQGL
jgi:hypothetical protein